MCSEFLLNFLGGRVNWSFYYVGPAKIWTSRKITWHTAKTFYKWNLLTLHQMLEILSVVLNAFLLIEKFTFMHWSSWETGKSPFQLFPFNSTMSGFICKLFAYEFSINQSHSLMLRWVYSLHHYLSQTVWDMYLS